MRLETGKVWRMPKRRRGEEAKGIGEGRDPGGGSHALDGLVSARSVITADSERVAGGLASMSGRKAQLQSASRRYGKGARGIEPRRGVLIPRRSGVGV
jgi:hypothetical protein